MDSLPYSYSIKLRDEIMKQVMVVRTDLKMGKGMLNAVMLVLELIRSATRIRLENGKARHMPRWLSKLLI